MLQGEMPFGSWRENELDTVAKIAKRKLNLPESFSPEAIDLITKVLQELQFSLSLSNVNGARITVSLHTYPL